MSEKKSAFEKPAPKKDLAHRIADKVDEVAHKIADKLDHPPEDHKKPVKKSGEKADTIQSHPKFDKFKKGNS